MDLHLNQENSRNRHVYRMLYTPPEPPGFHEASPYTSFKDLEAQYYMIQQSHSWAYIWKNHNSNTYLHPNVHSSTIYNSQDIEAT